MIVYVVMATRCLRKQADKLFLPIGSLRRGLCRTLFCCGSFSTLGRYYGRLPVPNHAKVCHLLIGIVQSHLQQLPALATIKYGNAYGNGSQHT
jgi:hypothetical protein